MSVPSSWASIQDWMRMVARDLNPVVEGHPFMSLATNPSIRTAGFTYYYTTVKVVRTWDGSNWQDHW